MVYPATLRPIGPGECIYCQKPSNILTEEHVVPSGLGGSRTLPNASCESCRQITHAFETTALRHTLGPGRYWLGIPTRKRKKRPEHWPAYKTNADGSHTKIMIPVEDLPFFLCMPTYQCNPMIKPVIPKDHIPTVKDDGVIVSEDDESFKNKLSTYGADFVSPLIDHIAFARMLAKIALGYCVIEFGRGNFTPVVSPLILGHTNGYRNLVSTSHFSSEREKITKPLLPAYNHDIMHKITTDTNVICVRIDLFTNLDCPSYYVIAGGQGDQRIRFSASAGS
jgi:hypothetical protein